MAQLITWLDGYAALSITDPLRIERALKSHTESDIDQIWRSAKKDVSTIADLPSQSLEVKRNSRVSSYARLASIVMTFISFAFLIALYYLHFDLELLGNPIIPPGIVIGVMYASIMVSLLATRRLNSAIHSYYAKHSSELAKNRIKLREAAQTLIDRLQRDVVSHDLNPERFKFQVFHTDYRNIVVLKGQGSRHTATVRSRAQTKQRT